MMHASSFIIINPVVIINLVIINLVCAIGGEVESVRVELVPCTVINMDFFDRQEPMHVSWEDYYYCLIYFCRLLTCGVVRESGFIVKCFDEVCGDFVISDELRKASNWLWLL